MYVYIFPIYYDYNRTDNVYVRVGILYFYETKYFKIADMLTSWLHLVTGGILL